MIEDEQCHPFQHWCAHPGIWVRWHSDQCRCRVVQYFDAPRCRRALALPSLEEPVRIAIYTRLQELGEPRD